MRGVLVEVPESLLAERARLGLDIRDEMWEGVLHMGPQPIWEHQHLGAELLVVLARVVKRNGLVIVYETELHRAEDDWRVPDLLVVDPAEHGRRGVDGRAELAVEIRSPGDETYEKLGFYAAKELGELLVIDRDTKAVELFILQDGRLEPSAPDDEGWLRSPRLGVGFRHGEDAKLDVEVDGDVASIP
jgi:Uma2 family endonuclease